MDSVTLMLLLLIGGGLLLGGIGLWDNRRRERERRDHP